MGIWGLCSRADRLGDPDVLGAGEDVGEALRQEHTSIWHL